MTGTGATSRTTTPDGRAALTKSLDDAPPLFFEREAAGLRALAAAGARVPEVLRVGDDSITVAWVEEGPGRTTASEEAFGRDLARLHATTGERYGAHDGEPTAYLGACPVDLTPTATWHESWVERRLLPLARRAVEAGRLDAATAVLAEEVTPERLGPVEPPTLVHGDLWGGNRLVDRAGASWLIDPCAQHGHREVDLAMMQLFGGFGGRAFAAYVEAAPLAPGWQARVAVYQTVPLLLHALLFGGGYGVQAGDALRAAVR
ncbi:fructosamine kinase family protein [Ornithinimicrobium cerasi]|uniref:fructosamine kinase family protein n=1 Tax=Ornithinimicrobium cerasi TaxID=2248773 RepID=UPI000EFFE7C2|nr:fructosamine kinase family protein [Ornithinimicrobium cerasi]